MAVNKSKMDILYGIHLKEFDKFKSSNNFMECYYTVYGDYDDDIDNDDLEFIYHENIVDYEYLPDQYQRDRSGRLIDMDTIYDKEVLRNKKINRILYGE